MEQDKVVARLGDFDAAAAAADAAHHVHNEDFLSGSEIRSMPCTHTHQKTTKPRHTY